MDDEKFWTGLKQLWSHHPGMKSKPHLTPDFDKEQAVRLKWQRELENCVFEGYGSDQSTEDSCFNPLSSDSITEGTCYSDEEASEDKSSPVEHPSGVVPLVDACDQISPDPRWQVGELCGTFQDALNIDDSPAPALELEALPPEHSSVTDSMDNLAVHADVSQKS
jgi:hypothetical protein